VDPWFLVEAAPEITRLIRTAREVNDGQPAFVAEHIRKMAGGLQGKTIAFLGLTFKPNVDDVRESPAVELVHNLQAAGASVYAYEPFKDNVHLAGVNQVSSLEAALVDVDLVVLGVAHDCFKDLDPLKVRGLTSARLVYDAVNAWDKSRWEAVGFQFYGLARK
jgi:UDP-N-acetyl-D-mannosaminuronic acid dehydrogenase